MHPIVVSNYLWLKFHHNLGSAFRIYDFTEVVRRVNLKLGLGISWSSNIGYIFSYMLKEPQN